MNASRALSDLLSREFRVSFPETKMFPLGAVASALGGEEPPACGVFVGISGDIEGGSLLLLPLANALGFCDLLLGREAGAAAQLGEQEGAGGFPHPAQRHPGPVRGAAGPAGTAPRWTCWPAPWPTASGRGPWG